MSILRNLLGNFVPVRERRETFGTLAAATGGGSEVVHDCNGDESATIYLNASAGTWNATTEISGSVDGSNFLPIPAYTYSPGCTGGTIPVASQPIITEPINTTSVVRVYCLAVGQLKKIRIRNAAWTTGSANVTIVSEAAASMHPFVAGQKSESLIISATGAAGAAVTATLPAVTSLRHYINFIQVTRSATAALTASATPVVTSSVNIPGPLVLTFGQDVAGIGIDKEVKIDFGASGLAVVAAGTLTSITCPVYTGVVWRINIGYRLGL